MLTHRLPTLYVVTDRHQVQEQKFFDILECIIKERGVMHQLREKDLNTRELLSYAQQIQKMACRYQVPFLINDRVDLVDALGMDGVHLPVSYTHLPLPPILIV